MHAAVFGTGAVGASFGGRLAKAGEYVSFLARGDTLRAIRERGLHVTSPEGDFAIHPPASPTLPPNSAPPTSSSSASKPGRSPTPAAP